MYSADINVRKGIEYGNCSHWETALKIHEKGFFNSRNRIRFFNIDRTLRALIGQKPIFYQSVKHRKMVFYCFSPIASIS